MPRNRTGLSFLNPTRTINPTKGGVFAARVLYTLTDNTTDPDIFSLIGEWSAIGSIFFKKFDVFTCQFSGAVFHPVCYDYPEKKYKEISESKVLGKFSSVKNLISKLTTLTMIEYFVKLLRIKKK